MSFHYRYRKQIIIGLIIGILLISGIAYSIYSIYKNKDKEEKNELLIKKKDNIKEETKNESKVLYQVDIKGEVQNPGIYSLEASSRIIDVINKAGGLKENANTSVINLSKKIIDEMVIIVYSNDQVANFKETKEEENIIIDKCIEGENGNLKNDACIEKEDTKVSGKISINNATKEELMTLPGIGESKADSIIKYREENGNFETIEDITKVSGIGENLFAQIKENITT